MPTGGAGSLDGLLAALRAFRDRYVKHLGNLQSLFAEPLANDPRCARTLVQQ